MILTLSAAPTTEPVTLQEAKDHLRVEHTEDDALIEVIIGAAREHVEQATSRALITQTWEYYLNSFPIMIKLPRPPLQSVTSITYTDSTGTPQTLSSSIYTVDTHSEPALVYEAYNKSWPSTLSIPKAVKVTYVAGYGDDQGDVPDPIRQALLILIAHFYENRELVAPVALMPIERSVNALLAPYKIQSL